MRSIVVAVLTLASFVGFAAPAQAASQARTLTFTGALGDRWSATAPDGTTNWVMPGGGFATPENGDRLVFPAGLGQLQARDDIAGLSVRRLDLAAPVSIVGQPLTIAGGGITASGGGVARVHNALIARAQPTIAALGTRLVLGPVQLVRGAHVTFGQAGDAGGLLVVHAITGTGSVTKTGASVLDLRGENSYSGTTVLAEGRTYPESSHAFGFDTTTVEAGAVVDVRSNTPGSHYFGGEPLILDGGTIIGRLRFPQLTIASPSTLQVRGPVATIGLTGPGALTVQGSSVTLQVYDSPDYTGAVVFSGPAASSGWNFVVDSNSLGGPVSERGHVQLNQQGDIDGAVDVRTTADLSPAGTISTGRLDLLTDATLTMFVDSFPSEVDVSGSVHLAGRLEIFGGVQLPSGSSATLIANDGSDPVVGTFADLPEGSTVGGATISYVGGDGNDVTVTKQ